MPKQFDATLKDLAESYPSDWLTQLELPATGPVALVDADVSTITAQADKVLRVGGPDPWLLHLELQASRDPNFRAACCGIMCYCTVATTCRRTPPWCC